MKYSVVIISRNNRPMLLNCLASLRPEAAGRAEIIVAEAGEEPAPLEGEGLVHLRLPPASAGFSPQRNAGVRAASGEYVIFIDDDIEVPPGWFDRMTGGAHERPEVSGCMGAVFPRPAGPVSFLTGVLGHPGGGFRLHHYSRGSEIPLPQVATCNTVMRRSVIGEAGGFSAAFRSGSEDSELSIRIREKRGADPFVYLPAARAWHHSKDSLGPALRWYVRRGEADADLFVAHRSHRAYALRTSLALKLLPVLALSPFYPPLLPAAFAAWYLVQLCRMRFMYDYFPPYGFSAGLRLAVFCLAPAFKLAADLAMDYGRARRAAGLLL